MSIDENTAASVNNLFKEVQTKLQLHVQDLTKIADKISDKIAEVTTATVKAVDQVAPVVEAAVPVAAPEVGIVKEVLDGIANEIEKLHAKFDTLTGNNAPEAVEPNSEAEVAQSEPVEPTSAPTSTPPTTTSGDTTEAASSNPTSGSTTTGGSSGN